MAAPAQPIVTSAATFTFQDFLRVVRAMPPAARNLLAAALDAVADEDEASGPTGSVPKPDFMPGMRCGGVKFVTVPLAIVAILATRITTASLAAELREQPGADSERRVVQGPLDFVGATPFATCSRKCALCSCLSHPDVAGTGRRTCHVVIRAAV